jgi:6-phosphogluconate dehydrogenase
MAYRNEFKSIGIVGLGKMGINLAQNIKNSEITPFAYNRTKSKLEEVEGLGIKGFYNIRDLVKSLDERKVIWIMVSKGKAVDDILQKLVPNLSYGDIIIDGGNSHYEDTIKRAQILDEEGIKLLDAGVSGGIVGARNGANIVVGGDEEAFKYVEDLFKNICVDGGYKYLGKSGSGHFVKMVYNGIENAIMEAVGEGFEILESSIFDFDYKKIAEVWNNGSIIRGHLMEILQKEFSEDGKLMNLDEKFDLSSDGIWPVEEALKKKIPIPVITGALFSKYNLESLNSFSGKVVAAQRKGFSKLR